MEKIKYVILLIGLAGIARTDRKEKRISNKVLNVFLMLRILLVLTEIIGQTANFRSSLNATVSGFVTGGAIFFLAYCLSKKKLGAGDVKLMAVTGSYLGGERVLWAAFFAVNYAAGYFFWKLLMRKESIEIQEAFAPFVLAGVITELLMNERLF